MFGMEPYFWSELFGVIVIAAVAWIAGYELGKGQRRGFRRWRDTIDPSQRPERFR